MNKLDQQYTDLLKTILEYGVDKKDRTGTGTKSIFGYTIRHNMKDGFPLLTTKKMPWKSIVTELLWFLQGNTNIKWLVDNGCNIWDGDAYKNYLNVVMYEKPDYLHEKHGHLNMSVEKEGDWYLTLTQEEFINRIKTDDKFAEKWGELGPIYGKQWRKWNSITKKWWDDPEYQGYGADTRSGWEYEETQIDQISRLIYELTNNPDSRRLMVNAWNVGELDQMVLPPCHYGFQVYTRELSLDERRELMVKYTNDNNLLPIGFSVPFGEESNKKYLKVCDSYNIPTRAISLMWNQRSVDTFLGLPFNIASYGLLLMMIADEVGMVPDQLIGSLGDVHLYSNHIEQAKEQIGRKYTHEERTELLKQAMGEENYNKAVDELMPFGGGLSEYYDSHKIPYMTREPFPLPTVHVRDGIYCSSHSDVLLFDYESHPAIKAPLSN